MAQPDADRSHGMTLTPLGWCVVSGAAALAVISLFGLWQCDDIELTPVRSGLVFVPAVIGALAIAVLTGIVAATQSRGFGPRRVGLTAGLSIVTFISLLRIGLPATDLVLQTLDLPPERTQSHMADLAVATSYVAHNHGDSWHVVTASASADLAVSQGDYGFIQSHPGEPVCVHVMLQQAGSATRIANGRRILPDGSVELCPKAGG